MLFFGIFPSILRADFAPVRPFQSGCVMPIRNYDIKLKSEVVTIVLYRDHYDVEVSYVFINSGDEQKVMMGFPNRASDGMYFQGIANFKAYEDSTQKITWRQDAWNSKQNYEDLKNGKITNEYYDENCFDFYDCFQVEFKKGEVKHIRNTYSQDYATIYDDTLLTAKYILTTGAFWKDNIDSITVNIYAKGIPSQYLAKRTAHFEEWKDKSGNPLEPKFSGICFNPDTFNFSDNKYHCLFTDTEPDFNINISMPPMMVKSIRATSELKSNSHYSYNAENMVDNDYSTAWADGKNGEIKDTISLHIGPNIHLADGDYYIKKIGIVNGLAADSTTFFNNNRAKKIKIYYQSMYNRENKVYPANNTTIDNVVANIINSSHDIFKEVELSDIMEMQFIEFPPKTLMSDVTIIIESVYPGMKYDDTCISEIQFFPE